MLVKMPRYLYIGIGLLVAGIALIVYTAMTTEWRAYTDFIMLPTDEFLPYFIASIPMIIAGIVLTALAFIKHKMEVTRV